MVLSWLLLAAVVVVTSARSTLELKGEDASIEMAGASMSFGCLNSPAPLVKSVSPQVVGQGAPVTVYLVNTPTTCARSEISEPCATVDAASHPPLWFCVYADDSHQHTFGPLTAIPKEETGPGGTLLGVHVRIECPTPSPASFVTNATYVLSLRHGYGPSAVNISFGGIPEGDVVTVVTSLPPPPVVPPAPAPPPPPTNYFGSGALGDLVFDGTSTTIVSPSASTYQLPLPAVSGPYDGDMVVVEARNLTIESGATVTTAQPGRGLLLVVQGDVTIDGTLSMTARGACTPDLLSTVDPAGLRVTAPPAPSRAQATHLAPSRMAARPDSLTSLACHVSCLVAAARLPSRWCCTQRLGELRQQRRAGAKGGRFSCGGLCLALRGERGAGHRPLSQGRAARRPGWG